MNTSVSFPALALLLLSASLAGGAHAQESPTSCGPRPPDDAVAPTVESLMRLEGHLRLFAVDTVNVRVSGTGHGIELRRPDSALVAEWQTRGMKFERSKGQGRPPVVVLTEGRRPLLVGVRAAGAEPWWDERSVLMGATFIRNACPLYFFCTDGNPVDFSIDRVSPAGAWGHWKDNQTGLGRLVDERGKFLADPAGFFCLLRSAHDPA